MFTVIMLIVMTLGLISIATNVSKEATRSQIKDPSALQLADKLYKACLYVESLEQQVRERDKVIDRQRANLTRLTEENSRFIALYNNVISIKRGH